MTRTPPMVEPRPRVTKPLVVAAAPPVPAAEANKTKVGDPAVTNIVAPPDTKTFATLESLFSIAVFASSTRSCGNYITSSSFMSGMQLSGSNSMVYRSVLLSTSSIRPKNTCC